MKRFELDKYKSDIVKLYIEEKMSCKEIANIYSCSLSGIYDALKRWQINTRDLVYSHRKKIYDENYFKIIDSEEKSYWLGFIYADGYITSGNNIGISLSKIDESHLYKFISSIEGNFSPKTYRGTGYSHNEYCRVMLKSKIMIEDLLNVGIKYKKSLKLEFPNYTIVPKKYIRHFIRGYFDGDGSIVLSKNSINFKLCGTKEFLTGVINELNKNCSYIYKHILYKRKEENKNTYYISYGGRLKVKDAMDFLYKDSKIYLERKFIKYNKL